MPVPQRCISARVCVCLLNTAYCTLETGDCTLAIDIESPRSESMRANHDMTIFASVPSPSHSPSPSPFPFLPNTALFQVTRVLAEEQFMKRALIEKIQSGMAAAAARGPPGDAGWPVSAEWR